MAKVSTNPSKISPFRARANGNSRNSACVLGWTLRACPIVRRTLSLVVVGRRRFAAAKGRKPLDQPVRVGRPRGGISPVGQQPPLGPVGFQHPQPRPVAGTQRHHVGQRQACVRGLASWPVAGSTLISR